MSAMNEIQVLEVWTAYKAAPTERLRNVLIEHYLPLVHRAVRDLSRHLPKSVDADDLFGSGVFGLLNAIEAYDLDRKIGFSSFSALRIRGAILDELRTNDWMPRQVRARGRAATQAESALRQELGRPPSEQEVADRLRWKPEQLADLTRHLRASSTVTLDSQYRSSSDGDSAAPSLPADPRAVDPGRESQRRVMKEYIMTGLTRAERLIVILYYYEELTLREIGQVIDVCESRVSQMHASILNRLRAKILLPGKRDLREPLSVTAAAS